MNSQYFLGLSFSFLIQQYLIDWGKLFQNSIKSIKSDFLFDYFEEKNIEFKSNCHVTELLIRKTYCVKIVRIRSYFGPHFPAFGPE